MATTIRNSIEEALRTIDSGIAEAQAAAATDPSGNGGRLLAFLQSIRPPYADLLADPVFNQERDLASRFRPYPDDPRKFSLVRRAATLDLSSINRIHHLDTEMPRLNELARRFEELRRQVLADAQAQRTDAGAREKNARLVRAARELVAQTVRVLQIEVSFQQSFTVLRKGEPDFADFAAAHFLVDPRHLLQPVSSLGFRVSHRVWEDQPGPTARPIGEKLKLLLERLDPTNQGLAGIVLVENPTQPLTLAGPLLKGHLCLAVTGSVTVQNLTGGPRDLLTLIALGGSSGTVTLGGQIHSSLVLTGYRLRVEPGTQVLGSLILHDMDWETSRHFEGAVNRDDRLARSDRSDFLWVLLSPWARTYSSFRS